MILSLIVAASENNVIGVKNALPWHLPDDMKHFKDLTSGHPIIMGRKTYESIGHPLPKRKNIVITRQPDYRADGCSVVGSLADAVTVAKMEGAREAFIIGGGEIYKESMEEADKIYFTRVHTTLEGDAFFPSVDPKEWKEVSREEHAKDETHENTFTFLMYERVG